MTERKQADEARTGGREMTDKLIEQIKADREVGTPGPWRVHDCESYGESWRIV